MKDKAPKVYRHLTGRNQLRPLNPEPGPPRPDSVTAPPAPPATRASP